MKRDPLAELCINTLRTLSIDAVQKANSGHPGLPLGAAAMGYVLWTDFLRHNPKNPDWYNRDRFVLSAGHGSMLLYSLLHLTGYPLSLNDIKQFRQWGSKTPGHPERELTKGVETTTGPLGQGFGNGVGMAIAEAYLASQFNKPGFKIIDHYTYGIVSDGDLMEGVSSEAASLAGHLRLGKLIYLYDDNSMTLSATSDLSFTEDKRKRFEAYGWHTEVVKDGNDIEALHKAIAASRAQTEKPSLILIKTIIGYGSPHKENTFEVHGSPLGKEEVKLTKQNLHWPYKSDFYVPDKVKKYFHEAINKGKRAENDWNKLLKSYERKYPELSKKLREMMQNQLPQDWNKNIPDFPADAKGLATREASGKVMQAFSPNLPGFIGGSADLNPSTKTALENFGNFESSNLKKDDTQGSLDGGWNYQGRNIFYGVREHAMGSISNGLATYPGIIPFAATFLVFSDYMRPPMRLAALMQLHVIYVFTHDSIGLGEDGPTHQPVEQLVGLRAIPHMTVIRPADANETAIAWQIAIEKSHPVSLILTRQKVPTLDRKKYASAEGVRKGAYILSEAKGGKPKIILIATGSEIHLIVDAQQKLEAQSIPTRVVSMPSWELFEAQTKKYQEKIFPRQYKKRLVIEAGSSQGWEKYAGDEGAIISVNDFGASAPGDEMFQKYGFTVENICKQAKKILKRKLR